MAQAGTQIRSGRRARFDGPTTRTEQRDELIRNHLDLARRIALGFTGRGEPLDDLVQVANLGLLKAAERYDPAREVKFTTFATSTIRGELKRHFRDRTWTLRTSRRLQENYLRVKDAVDVLGGAHGRSPSLDEIAEYVGVSVEEVCEAMEAGSNLRALSLDVPDAEDSNSTIGDQVGGYDGAFDCVDRMSTLEPLLAVLTDRERTIIRLRFVEGLSQADIGAHVNLSQMHVSRLLRDLLRRLRAGIPE